MSSGYSLHEELEAGLRNGDLSLLTRRMLDVTAEHEVLKGLREKALDLRKQYLEAEDESTLQNNKQAILELASTFAAELKALMPLGEPEAAWTDSTVLTANGLSKQFTRGKKPFHLQPLDVRLDYGQITGVVGENGNGKTTLLRMLAGDLACSAGDISYPAMRVKDGDWYHIKQKLAFIPQRIPRWYGSLSDNLHFFTTIHGITGKENEEHVDFILFRLGLDKFRDLKWTEISSGYRLRFEFAKMLLRRPQLLILDEPLANLDINAQQLFLQDIKFFVQSKTNPMSVVLSSQNLYEIEQVASHIIFIKQGNTLYNGSRAEFETDREVNTFELAGNFALASLSRCLQILSGVTVEDTGTSFIVKTAKNVRIYDIVNLLEKENLELGYIRDISRSARKLFHKDM